MNRLLTGLAVFVVGSVPLLLKPTWVIAVLAIGASIFCIVGLFWRLLGATLTGCVVATINLALALWWSGASLNALCAVAFGIAQLLLLESTHFADRFAGAMIERSASRSHMAWWIAHTALCFLVAILLLVIASALTALMPAYGRSMIAAVGALLAFATALKVALS